MPCNTCLFDNTSANPTTLQAEHLLNAQNKLDIQILSHINSHNSTSDVKILSIIAEGGEVSLDGIVKIAS